MWVLDHKEGWVPKNGCFWTVVLEKTLESPLDYKEIKSVSPKRNLPWIFIGRTDAEAEALFNALATWWEDSAHWKRPWCWERLKAKGDRATEDKMFGWHHWFNGHEFEQASGDSEGQGRLACCSSWGCKELTLQRLTEWVNNKTTSGWFWHPLTSEIICSSEQPFSSFLKIPV